MTDCVDVISRSFWRLGRSTWRQGSAFPLRFGQKYWTRLRVAPCHCYRLVESTPSGAGSSISFLIIFPKAALSSSFDPTLMNRTTPRRSIKNVVGMLETE